MVGLGLAPARLKPITTPERNPSKPVAARPRAPRARLPDAFWESVRSAETRLLALDYDGTLAPFHRERMAATPSAGIVETIQAIIETGDTRVAIVSGRPSAEVRELMGGLPVETFGAHGFERSRAPGHVEDQELPASERAGLARAREAAEGAGLSAHIEAKPASVAVHTRGLEPERALEVEELAYHVFTPVARAHGLGCRAFNGGVEIRSRSFHKGQAIEALLAESPAGVFAVYVGDDETDEDAFRALAGRGVGVRVGVADAGTAAQACLPSQADVLPFLQGWRYTAAGRGRHVSPARSAPRVVVVSNRLPAAGTAEKGTRAVPVGGLAFALEAALRQSPGGGVWMGWSGRTTRGERGVGEEKPLTESLGLVGIDLTAREYDAYYKGFSNRTIWPLFHSFPRDAEFSSWHLEIYRSVNAMFANALMSTLRVDDLVWVNDYHLLLVGRELREAGWRGRVGLFLHIPFPGLDILGILPEYEQFLRALLDYDVVGFQTAGFRANYVYACRRVLGAEWDGETLRWGTRAQRVGVYPVGIDVERFARGEDVREPGRVKSLRRAIGEGALILGVDRLDYTKGMPERIQAFEALFRLYPRFKRRVSYVQISSPSRTDVAQYRQLKRDTDAIVGRVNGALSEHDWEPIRYLYRSYPQEDLIGFYRNARVGLVTPLRDGMNLVAKEYVAAQVPEDPGVLVLSRFAGAADELGDAVLVNPFMAEDVAHGIARALEMPIEERRERHAAMMSRVREQTVHKWASDYLADLRG